MVVTSTPAFKELPSPIIEHMGNFIMNLKLAFVDLDHKGVGRGRVLTHII
jgi:hypothetical protein